MATRIYTRSSGSVGVTPTDWEFAEQINPVTVPGSLTAGPAQPNSAMTTSTQATGVTSPILRAMGRTILGPLDAQTITGTVTGQMRGSESNAGANATLALAIKLVTPAGADRGILLAPTARDTSIARPPELAAALTNTPFENSAEQTSIPLTSQTAQAGDFLVIEWGFRAATTTSRTISLSYGSDSSTDLPANSTETQAFNPWWELSHTLTFIGPITPSVTDAATLTEAVTAVVPMLPALPSAGSVVLSELVSLVRVIPGLFAFANAETVTIPGATHGYATPALLIQAWDHRLPHHLLRPGAVTVDDVSFDVTVTFLQPTTGYLVISGASAGTGDPPDSSTTFAATDTVTILGTTHGLGTPVLLVQVWDASTPREALLPGTVTVDEETYDVVLTFLQPQSGTVVLSRPGTGTANAQIPFTAVTQATILESGGHARETAALLVQVYDATTPDHAQFVPGSLTVDPTTHTLVVSFLQPQSGFVVVSGPTPQLILSRSLADALTVSDLPVLRLPVLLISASETVTLADPVVVRPPAGRAEASEAGTVADVPLLRLPVLLLGVQDAMTFTDLPTVAGLTLALVVTETVTGSATADLGGVLVPETLSAGTISEVVVVRVPFLVVAPTSPVALAETVTVDVRLLLLTASTLTVAETISAQVPLLLIVVADTVTLSSVESFLGVLTPTVSSLGSVTETVSVVLPILPVAVLETLLLADVPSLGGAIQVSPLSAVAVQDLPSLRLPVLSAVASEEVSVTSLSTLTLAVSLSVTSTVTSATLPTVLASAVLIVVSETALLSATPNFGGILSISVQDTTTLAESPTLFSTLVFVTATEAVQGATLVTMRETLAQQWPFTAALTFTIAGVDHGYGTAALLLQVWDNGTPHTLLEPGTVTIHDTTYDVTVTFAQPTSGYVVLSAAERALDSLTNYVGQFTSTLTHTIPGATHAQGTLGLLVQVWDTSDPAEVLVPGAVTVADGSYDVVLTFAQPTAGTVILSRPGPGIPHALVPFASATDVTIPGTTHARETAAVLVQVWDATSPVHTLVTPGSVTVNGSTRAITLHFAQATAGQAVIGGAPVEGVWQIMVSEDVVTQDVRTLRLPLLPLTVLAGLTVSDVPVLRTWYTLLAGEAVTGQASSMVSLLVQPVIATSLSLQDIPAWTLSAAVSVAETLTVATVPVVVLPMLFVSVVATVQGATVATPQAQVEGIVLLQVSEAVSLTETVALREPRLLVTVLETLHSADVPTPYVQVEGIVPLQVSASALLATTVALHLPLLRLEVAETLTLSDVPGLSSTLPLVTSSAAALTTVVQIRLPLLRLATLDAVTLAETSVLRLPFLPLTSVSALTVEETVQIIRSLEGVWQTQVSEEARLSESVTVEVRLTVQAAETVATMESCLLTSTNRLAATDGGILSEVPVLHLLVALAPVETLALSDVPVLLLPWLFVTASDTLTLLPSVSLVLPLLHVTQVDALTAGDVATLTVLGESTRGVSVEEEIRVSETLLLHVPLTVPTSEAVTLSDTVTVTLLLQPQMSEGVTLSTLITGVPTLVIVLVETLTVTPLVPLTVQRMPLSIMGVRTTLKAPRGTNVSLLPTGQAIVTVT